MRGLVTVFGGSGFVGRAVVRSLAKRGVPVRVAVRQAGRGYRLRPLGDVGQVEIVQANLRDSDSVVRALQGAESVVNLVGLLFQRGPQNFQAVHVEGAERLAQAAAAIGIRRFVQMSAIGADPQSAAAYGRTKAAAESAVLQAIPTASIVRPSIIFGPDDGFFNRFGEMAAMSPVLPLIGGGETRFQPVYAADVGQAVARLATSPEGEGKTYELGGPGVYSFRELMELVCQETQRTPLLWPVPRLLASLLATVGDLVTPIMAPPLTTDQLALLGVDNVVSQGAADLASLGIPATALEPILSSYLYRYRKGGQYAEAAG